ncbi:SufE family protein [Candidatus Woesearchaeota archaeon]|nr:SufE family protein [Candidatus Woesearchaeota archaeon]
METDGDVGLAARCNSFLREYEDRVAVYRKWDMPRPEFLYLKELGEKLPPFPEHKRIDSNLVTKCESNVYFTGCLQDGRMQYQAASDSAFVRGEIYILLHLFNGMAPSEILSEQTRPALKSFFRKLTEIAPISTKRQYGLEGMYERIAAMARYCGSGQCRCDEADPAVSPVPLVSPVEDAK